MQRSGVPDWGSIGRIAVLSSLAGAVITFFVLPDQRWIAAIFVGVAVIDALVFWVLVPRLGGAGTGGAPSLSELEQMNADAEWGGPAEDPFADKKPYDVWAP